MKEDYLKQIIKICLEAGFNRKAFVCDQGTNDIVALKKIIVIPFFHL